jgi:hypothetical protein
MKIRGLRVAGSVACSAATDQAIGEKSVKLGQTTQPLRDQIVSKTNRRRPLIFVLV